MATKSVDLNLFRVFESLMRHRSVTAVARDLNVTPSAVSHALARLRKSLDDALFTAGTAGMEPTSYALGIAPAIREGLDLLLQVLDPQEFTPATMTRVFKLCATDYTMTRIVVPLISALRVEAPLAGIRVFPPGRLDIMRSLDDGRIDLVLGWFGEMSSNYQRRQICTECEALVVRADHPLAAMTLTTEAILAFPFLVVELTGSEDMGLGGFIEERRSRRRTWIDRLLVETEERQKGACAGRVFATVPFYSAVAPILQSTDMVATLPHSIATSLAEREGLAVLPLPYERLQVTVEAAWSERLDNDRELQWLIDRATALTAR